MIKTKVSVISLRSILLYETCVGIKALAYAAKRLLFQSYFLFFIFGTLLVLKPIQFILLVSL